MPANLLVTYYSTFGHVHALGQAVAEGARTVSGTDVRVRRIAEIEAARQAMSSIPFYVQIQQQMSSIPEVSHDDLRWADGIAWGTPTRYGNMAAQVKQFLDTTGALWQAGELEDKPAGVFVSTANVGGGQESTIITTMVTLLHHGMILVGSPYGQNPGISGVDGRGGSPYGPGVIAGGDGSRQPNETELQTGRNLGVRLAKAAALLRELRRKQPHGEQPEQPVYTEGAPKENKQ